MQPGLCSPSTSLSVPFARTAEADAWVKGHQLSRLTTCVMKTISKGSCRLHSRHPPALSQRTWSLRQRVGREAASNISSFCFSGLRRSARPKLSWCAFRIASAFSVNFLSLSFAVPCLPFNLFARAIYAGRLLSLNDNSG